ncbi:MULTISPECIES: hypothetical protein [unclassified Aureimonas]|uniref:hypothetical protein n=1 Tax=unclassified Aureimonas TaxID=2615206 RepID=UPI0006FEB07E|nr:MULTISPECIES: hypothetical protein [unclassified Aureimonas]KQT61259.1 hypothetical protein ASG54_24290 [Aureimonas sp. Leaf460]KQT68708.1 hypothetical protein ASG62_19050 [Aureimonas sp. Leaf427]
MSGEIARQGRPRPGRRRTAALLQGALISTLGAAPALAAGPLVIALAGEERVLIDHDRDACEAWDIPDTPTRAYRDEKGLVHLFQTHHRNRASIGPSLDALRHRCDVVFEGDERGDPASFDNQSWIAATHTLDGRTVHAIVHDEFRGHRSGVCGPGEASACWYNGLTAAVSTDGGASFRAAEPHLVAALPFTAEETRGHHAGYFEPTNILGFDGAFYMMANVVSPPPQKPGNCLLRSENLADAGAWRGWRDGAFTTRFRNPYGPERIAPDTQLCDPVAPAALPWPVTSLTRFAKTGTFIATMKGRRRDDGGVERTGIYVATSPDLVRWTGPELLLEAPIFGACEPAEPIAYPALIDPESTDRNFGTVGGTALLTYVRARPDGCDLGPDRDVAMRPVTIRER